MSFRRDHDAELEWRRWVRAHEAELIAVGIPREVWADRMTWWRFVEHGHHTADPRDIRLRPTTSPPTASTGSTGFWTRCFPGRGTVTRSGRSYGTGSIRAASPTDRKTP